MRQGMWVRIISYRVTDARLGEVDKVYRLVTTLLNPRVAPALDLIALYHERWEIELVIDEIKTHERMQRKVLRSKTPAGVYQELYGLFLAHYAVRVLMAQAAIEADLDPDRLSFTAGLFYLTEMIDLALTLEPAEATMPLLRRVRHQMASTVLPPRRLRINRREIKQVYSKYKPKKRHLAPPAPFEPDEQFLDFVALLDPLACSSPRRSLSEMYCPLWASVPFHHASRMLLIFTVLTRVGVPTGPCPDGISIPSRTVLVHVWRASWSRVAMLKNEAYLTRHTRKIDG
jgi:hypothetical protein